MTTWYVRKSGSDSNGGTSATTSPEKSGSNGTATNASTTFTVGSSTFVAGDAGKGIVISGGLYRIATYVSVTQVTLDRGFTGSTVSGSAVWAMGGARLSIGGVVNNTAANSPLVGGDTIYIGAGTYRELINPQQNFNATAQSNVTVVGDVDGANTGDSGQVQVTAYLTDDKTTPSTTATIYINQGVWAFSNLVFVGGLGGLAGTATAKVLGIGANYSAVASVVLPFTNCTFIALAPNINPPITFTANTTTTGSLRFDRCRFLVDGLITLTFPTGTLGDYFNPVEFRSSVIDCGGVQAVATGVNSGKGGSVSILNSWIRSNSPTNSVVKVSGNAMSLTYPSYVQGCVVVGGNAIAGLVASVSGQLKDDHNLILAANPYANVTAGTGSVSGVGAYAPLWHFGQELSWGGQVRPYTMPTAGSPLLGFGNALYGYSYDIQNLTRPSGGASPLYAVGAYERTNCWVRETSIVHTGANSWSVTGPGYQDFTVPVVGGGSTVISVFVRHDSTYAGTNPQLSVTNGTECGVADQTVTATVFSQNAWEQLSLTVNPTRNGMITVRLASLDTNGAGRAFADSFAIN